ncbi:MAG: hypothetical protein R2795_10825 [Saprospiraceae bacterium]
MNETKRYPAKVLLFGEHTILRGSRALAMPLHAKYSHWDVQPNSVEALLDIKAWLRIQLPTAFDFKQMELDYERGVCLQSNIPVGYGLGSSGSVCVAIFDRYATREGQEQMQEMGAKAMLARMESFFHGTSSGTDPLIIYLNKTVELLPNGTYQTVTLQGLPNGWCFFLLDTRKARQTAPLVNHFLKQFDTDLSFQEQVKKEWALHTDNAIDALLCGDSNTLWDSFTRISRFQLEHLPLMVPDVIRSEWRRGLESDTWRLKICGAGGGGYCLGITKDWPDTQQQLEKWELIKLDSGRE